MDNDKVEDLGVSTDDNIEKTPVAPKPKKALTDKQKETLAKGRELRDQKRKERIAEKQRQEEEQKREIEEKIVKKAIAIKKKQIRKQKIIEPTPSEDEADDDEPPPVRRKAPPKQVAQPKAPSLAPQPAPKKPGIIFL
jgi:hypothetical protein